MSFSLSVQAQGKVKEQFKDQKEKIKEKLKDRDGEQVHQKDYDRPKKPKGVKNEKERGKGNALGHHTQGDRDHSGVKPKPRPVPSAQKPVQSKPRPTAKPVKPNKGNVGSKPAPRPNRTEAITPGTPRSAKAKRNLQARPKSESPRSLESRGNTFSKKKEKLSDRDFGKVRSEAAKERVKAKLNDYSREVVKADNEIKVYAEKIKKAKEKVSKEEKAGLITAQEAQAKRDKIKKAEARLNGLRLKISKEKSDLKSIR